MSSNAIVSNTTISGEEIAPIVEDIEEVIAGYDPNHQILALLCLVFLISDPSLEEDSPRLAEHIKEASRYIVLMLGAGEKGTVN